MSLITKIFMYLHVDNRSAALDHAKLKEHRTMESILACGNYYAKELVAKRLMNGLRFYSYVEEGVSVSFAWVRISDNHFIGELNKTISYGSQVVHIIDCKTPVEHRNKGYYAQLIRLVATEYSGFAVYIYTHQENIASRKGIEKAGFVLQEKYVRILFKVFKFNIKKDVLKVCFLPKYGLENPYQFLQIEGLKEMKINAFFGDNYRFLGIARNFYKFKPDWIHFDWIYTLYSINLPSVFKWFFYLLFKWQIKYLKTFTNCKLMFTVHNLERHEFYHDRIDALALKCIVQECDIVRFFSADAIEKFKQKYLIENTNAFRVLPEGSYVSYYENKVSPTEARQLLNISEDKKVFLYLGSVRPYKGIEDLVHSFVKYKKDNWLLIISGYPYSMEYTNYIKELVNNQEQIILNFEHIQEDRLQLFFNATNIVVLPFKKIENSGSLILSMGFKKPIIAPSKGAVTTRLKHQKQLLFEQDIDEILSKIDDFTDLENIGLENYKRVEQYRWSDMAQLFK